MRRASRPRPPLEHMAFEATRRRSALDIVQEIEAVGGDLNAQTSVECKFPPCPLLGEDVLVGPSKSRPTSSPSRHSTGWSCGARRAWWCCRRSAPARRCPTRRSVPPISWRTAFAGVLIGRCILGMPKTVRGAVGGIDARRPGAAVSRARDGAAAAGAVNDDGTASRRRARRFASIGAQSVVGAAGARPLCGRRRPQGARSSSKALDMVLGFAGLVVPRPGPRRPARAPTTCSGGGMSSRLFQEIREKRGLRYAVFTPSTSPSATPGPSRSMAAPGEDKLGEFIRPMLRSACARRPTKPTDEEAVRAKEQIKGVAPDGAGKSSAAAGQQTARHARLRPQDATERRQTTTKT